MNWGFLTLFLNVFDHLLCEMHPHVLYNSEVCLGELQENCQPFLVPAAVSFGSSGAMLILKWRPWRSEMRLAHESDRYFDISVTPKKIEK